MDSTDWRRFHSLYPKEARSLFQILRFALTLMMIQNRISNKYWLCQIAGWGFVTLVYIFIGYTFGNLSESTIIRMGLIILAGFLATHFLRWSVRQLNWQLLPIEKGIPRFLFATIIASVLAALIVVSFAICFEYTGVIDPDYGRKLGFSARLITSTVDQGTFITPWVLIYYFYHYVQKTRRQHQNELAQFNT